MDGRQKILAVILMVVLVAFGLSACSKADGPKNEEAIKVIQSAIEADLKGQSLKSEVVILEKGQKMPNGDWPVKVEYTAGKADGSTEKKVATYNLTPVIDSMGANSWNAVEAKK